jgi:hypothetical protein
MWMLLVIYVDMDSPLAQSLRYKVDSIPPVIDATQLDTSNEGTILDEN